MHRIKLHVKSIPPPFYIKKKPSGTYIAKNIKGENLSYI